MVNVKDMSLSKKLLGGLQHCHPAIIVVGIVGYNVVNTINSHLDE